MAELGFVLFVVEVGVLELSITEGRVRMRSLIDEGTWTNLVECTVLVRTVVKPTHDV